MNVLNLCDIITAFFALSHLMFFSGFFCLTDFFHIKTQKLNPIKFLLNTGLFYAFFC